MTMTIQFLAQLPGAHDFFVTAAWQQHGPVSTKWLWLPPQPHRFLRIYKAILHPKVNSSMGNPSWSRVLTKPTDKASLT